MSECGICDGMRICSCNDYKAMRFHAAVSAMAGLVAGIDTVLLPDDDMPIIAKMAVKQADALLAELGRRK